MEGNGSNGFASGPYAGFPDLSAASMSSGSNLNNNSTVSMGAGGPTFAPQGGVGDGTPSESTNSAMPPPAKRMKVEAPSPTTAAAATNNNSAAVANMAAIAANRAMTLPSSGGAPVGSGLSTEQFLHSLPGSYSTQTPAFMMMMMQQQQQHQQQQQQQLQMQAQAQAQLQMQRQYQAQQRQIQMQRQFQQAAGMSYGMPQTTSQPMMMPSTQTQAQSQAQAIMMAAMARNQATMQFMQQQQQQQQAQQQPIKAELPVYLHIPNREAAQPQKPLKPPQPTETPCCFICKDKDKAADSDLFICGSHCGLAAHPKCLGESQIFTMPGGAKFCGSCFVMQKDRTSNENLHKGGTVGISVRRAILCLNVETNAPTNFEKFGHLASLRLFEIAQIAGYPIAPFAMKFVEPHLRRWMTEKLIYVGSWQMNVRDVFTLMIGLYSLDRVGIAHGWRDKAIEIVAAKKFSTTDFLGWHPAIEGPNVRCSSLCSICCLRNPPELAQCARCQRPLMFPTIFTKFVSALLASHYAEHVGISFGTSFLDVLSHTHTVRGFYKGLKPFDADGYEWDMFADQMRMVFGFLDIMSNFGVLELDPSLFEPETKIIFNQFYINQAMLALEFEVIGKFLQCMKLFGAAKRHESRAVIESCERFLLMRQTPTGSWCKTGATVIDQYKATVVCAKALLQPVTQGRGPGSTDAHRMLVKWAKKTPGSVYAKRVEQLGQGKALASGATVRGRAVANAKKLDQFYRRQILPTSGLNALETLATARLRAIWPSQKPEPQDEEMMVVKDEVDLLPSATTDNEDAEPDSIISIKTEQQPEPTDGAEQPSADEQLISMSLTGDLSLFDGLKFEDGDVIDIGHNGADGDGDEEGKATTSDGEDEEEEEEEELAEKELADEEQDQAEKMDDDDDDGVYDDDDGEGGGEGEDDLREGSLPLPEPEMMATMTEQEHDFEAAAPSALDGVDSNTVDLSILASSGALDDDSYLQNSMDLALDM